MDASRVFNLDETAFESGKKSTQVVALRRSKICGTLTQKMNFHLSFVACGSASGFVVPPLFIFPGERVDNHILESCLLPGAAVTTTDSAFMNARLFAKWLTFFSDAVPANVTRPLLLVMDGCPSHIADLVIAEANKLRIILVCLPANATHLLQPLDVAVFASFKSKFKVIIDELIGGSAETSISKPMAIHIAALAWMNRNFEDNISSGFATCGIFPLSKIKMMEKLTNFERNGLPNSVSLAPWLRVKDIVLRDLLVLPPPRKGKGRKRKTTTVAGRVLTREMLRSDTPPSQKNKKKRKPRSKNAINARLETAADPVLYEIVV